MKRALVAWCFAAASFPYQAHADDGETSSPVPPLPVPAAPAAPAAAPPPVAAVEAPSPEAPSSDSPAIEPAHPTRLVWSIDGGFVHRQLYLVAINAAELSVAIGANFPRFSVGGILDGTFGATVDGLRTVTATAGPLFDLNAGVVHIGAGPRLGLLYIPRATGGDALSSTSLGVMGRVTADLLGTDSAESLYLVAKGTLDYVGTPLYGVTVGFGVRFLRL